MDKKLAVWLKEHGFAPTVKDGLRYLEEIRAKRLTQEMLDFLNGSINARMAMGGKATEESALKFLEEKLKTAQRLIAFWEENPKDTNAIFFFKKLSQESWADA